MSHLITVCPSEGGWALYRDGRALWTFAAADEADWAARTLAGFLAEQDSPVELRLERRDGQVAVQRLVGPDIVLRTLEPA